jgi:chemotaxis protein MotA
MIDRATVIGIVAAIALLISVIFAGAGVAFNAFWQMPSLLLVLGGSMLATLAAYPLARFLSLGSVIGKAVYESSDSPEDKVLTLVVLAEVARREGMLALEAPTERLDDQFLQQALRMAVDGTDAATIESVMNAEMESIDLRHTYGKGMLESIGRFAPVFGMIGTLIGLVIMLGHMQDPTQIGPGMAVAFLTTLYGLIIANIFCIPLAKKLAHRSSEELLLATIALKGVVAIQAGDHPRVVEQKLRVYLAPAQRNALTRERLAQMRSLLLLPVGEPIESAADSSDAGEYVAAA